MRKYIYGWISLLVLIFAINVNASAASSGDCKVTFQNNTGTSTSELYKKLKKTVKKGTTITLPTVSIRGYQVLGWTTQKGKKTPLYKCGQKYKITKKTTFYLVRKKNVYKAAFYDNTGNTSKAFQALKQKVYYGSTISLPKAPAYSGYRWLGWTNKKGFGTVKYAAGAKVKVTGNIRLYGVYRKTAKITLYTNNGKSVYKKKTVCAGDTYQLPSMVSPKGYTFLGWSTKPNQKTNPSYTARQKLTINGNQKLYAVCYPVSLEPDLAQLPLPDTAKYSKVIFVGDSRTQQARATFQALYHLDSPTFQNVEFICLSGSGIDWLKTVGYPELLEKIGEGTAEEKPIAVIFNHGVNDLNTSNSNPEYPPFMKQIAEELAPKHVKLFYMSVNPLNRADYEIYRNAKKKYEDRILTFNQMVKNTLCSNGMYQYIDCYQYLMKNGFSYDSGTKENGKNSGKNDGLHYTMKTYKRIYAYCIDAINHAK